MEIYKKATAVFYFGPQQALRGRCFLFNLESDGCVLILYNTSAQAEEPSQTKTAEFCSSSESTGSTAQHQPLISRTVTADGVAGETEAAVTTDEVTGDTEAAVTIEDEVAGETEAAVTKTDEVTGDTEAIVTTADEAAGDTEQL